MGKISLFDSSVLEMAIADGALEKVNREKIQTEANGEGLLVGCADGDQRGDTEDHLKSKGLHRRHEILSNGGPLSLGPGSPARSLNTMLKEFAVDITKEDWYGWMVRLFGVVLTVVGCLIRLDLVQLVQIYTGLKLKRMGVIILMPHVPCGVAGYYNLDVVAQLRNVIGAKRRLKRLFPNKRIMLLIHVDWSNGDRRTYRFSADTMEAWLDRNKEYFLSLKSPP